MNIREIIRNKAETIGIQSGTGGGGYATAHAAAAVHQRVDGTACEREPIFSALYHMKEYGDKCPFRAMMMVALHKRFSVEVLAEILELSTPRRTLKTTSEVTPIYYKHLLTDMFERVTITIR